MIRFDNFLRKRFGVLESELFWFCCELKQRLIWWNLWQTLKGLLFRHDRVVWFQASEAQRFFLSNIPPFGFFTLPHSLDQCSEPQNLHTLIPTTLGWTKTDVKPAWVNDCLDWELFTDVKLKVACSLLTVWVRKLDKVSIIDVNCCNSLTLQHVQANSTVKRGNSDTFYYLWNIFSYCLLILSFIVALLQ